MAYKQVATIINTHGIKGEVRAIVNSYGRFYELFKTDKVAYLFVKNSYLPLTIAEFKFHKSWIILKFINYDNINDVIKFKNHSLFLPEEHLKKSKLKASSVNLLDYTAFDYKTKNEIGKVVNFIDNSSKGLWIVADGEQLVYIPNEKVFIFKVIAIEQKVYFKLIPGMIDNENI